MPSAPKAAKRTNNAFNPKGTKVMYEDSHLESDYEDRYTIQDDYDEEDDLDEEDEDDNSDEDDNEDEYDEHEDSPSLQDMGYELGSYAN